MLYDQIVQFTFGIVSGSTNSTTMFGQLKSIWDYAPKGSEVIVVGGSNPGKGVSHIPFDDSQKSGWITRKKNLIAQNAQNEHVVIMHDYVSISPDWVSGFKIFGTDWNVAMTRVEDIFGRRFYDWVSWDSEEYDRYAPIPYSRKDHTSYQFIPGSYWVAKTQFMLDNPLDESLSWGQSEDIEWSLRVRSKDLVFNPYSKVRHLKKHRGFRFSHSINNDGLQIYPRPDFLNWEQL